MALVDAQALFFSLGRVLGYPKVSMAFYIRVLEGPIPRQIFKISPGMRLGRSKGEIILPDSKISSIHAQIEADNRGLLFLVDKDSSNGIKIDGEKVRRLALAHGVKFTLGKT